MRDLRSQLNTVLKGRVCLVGIGNVEQGDDGFGVRLAEALAPLGQSSPRSCVVVAGTSPEIWVNGLVHFDHVIFLDAVDFSGTPGSVVFLDAGEMAARFPQVSTHKLSLSVLAKWVEANGTTKAWLLGIQPESLRSGGHLTPTAHRTLTMLAELMSEIMARASVQSANRNPQTAIVW